MTTRAGGLVPFEGLVAPAASDERAAEFFDDARRQLHVFPILLGFVTSTWTRM